MLKIIIILLISLASLYLLTGFLLYFAQGRFLYYPPGNDFESCEGFSDFEKKEHNGTRFYHLERNPEKVLVHYHGNAESACSHAKNRHVFEAGNHSLIFVEYSGYAGDDQKPSKDLILKDAENIADFVEQKGFEEVTVYGQSIGSGPASHQTSLGNVDTLLLITPFAKFIDIAKRDFPVFPISMLLKENYDNIKSLENFEGKLVIIHGDKDRTVPQKFSKQLFDTVPTKNKEYIIVSNKGHNNLWGFEEFEEKLKEIIHERD